MYEVKNSQYELQIYDGISNTWKNHLGSVKLPDFGAALIALEAYNLEADRAIEQRRMTAADVKLVRIEAVPDFTLGYRFKLSGPKHMQKNDLDMLISYAFHTGEQWKYHCGMILAKEGEPVPAPYHNGMVIIHTMNGVQYVDYCTATKEEITKEKL